MIRKNKDALEFDARKQIYQLIEDVPGLHFREICRRLGMVPSVAEYHIRSLVKNELIVSRKEGKFKRYYVVGTVDAREKALVGTLRKKVVRDILIHILLNPGINHKELHEFFDISLSTLSFHLKKLLKMGIIKVEKRGRESYYFVVDEEKVGNAIIKYREDTGDKLADSFAEVWTSLHP